jgi:hypothetical protein
MQSEWPVAAAKNLRLFAHHVLPVLRSDPAFAGHPIDAPAGTLVTPSQPAGGILTPASEMNRGVMKLCGGRH